MRTKFKSTHPIKHTLRCQESFDLRCKSHVCPLENQQQLKHQRGVLGADVAVPGMQLVLAGRADVQFDVKREPQEEIRRLEQHGPVLGLQGLRIDCFALQNGNSTSTDRGRLYQRITKQAQTV